MTEMKNKNKNNTQFSFSTIRHTKKQKDYFRVVNNKNQRSNKTKKINQSINKRKTRLVR